MYHVNLSSGLNWLLYFVFFKLQEEEAETETETETYRAGLYYD